MKALLPGKLRLVAVAALLMLLNGAAGIAPVSASASGAARTLRALVAELSRATGLAEEQVARRVLQRYNQTWRGTYRLRSARNWDDLVALDRGNRGFTKVARDDSAFLDSIGFAPETSRVGRGYEAHKRRFLGPSNGSSAEPRWNRSLERAGQDLAPRARAAFMEDLSGWYLPFRGDSTALRNLERIAMAEARIRARSGRGLLGRSCASIESGAALEKLAAIVEAGAERIRITGAPKSAKAWARLIDDAFGRVRPGLTRSQRSARICGLIRGCGLFRPEYGTFFCGAGR